MNHLNIRLGVSQLLATMMLLMSLSGIAADPLLDQEFEAQIPAQSLSQSLLALSRQSRTQILVLAEPLQDLEAPAVQGRMTLRRALDQLLAGTDLRYQTAGATTVSIHSGQDVEDAMSLDSLLAGTPSATQAAQEPEVIESVPADNGESATNAVSAPQKRRVVDEIVVTANRRTQNVQDIAGGIEVFDGEALEKSGAAGFADYIFNVPGADLVNDGANQKIALRGVSNMAPPIFGGGGTASPIGVYLSDTPIQGNGNLPDLDLYDLERIEVLKGPQGTLYGEGAQGGAIKLLLNKADPSEFFAKSETGVGQTVNGSGWNHQQKLAVNVPLSGSWAARLVGTRRVDQGFIDFPNRGTRGEDDKSNVMWRLHLDGEIWEGFTASALLFHQTQRLNQFPMFQIDEGDLQNRNLEPQFADTDFTIGGLTLDYELSFATLTSSTSVFRNVQSKLYRLPIVGFLVFSGLGPVTGLEQSDFQEFPASVEQEWTDTANEQIGITQEFRLVSSGDDWVDWVVGAFYRKRTNNYNWIATNTESQQQPPPTGPALLGQEGVESFEQYALFGEATLELLRNLELTIGLRGFVEEVGLTGVQQFGSALYPLAVAAGEPDGKLPERSFSIGTAALSPKVSLSWFAHDWRMVYVTIAEGVRSGGPNGTALAADVPPVYDPDTLWNYEVGAKTEWLDGRLTANLAAFYNDWQNLQVTTNVEAGIGPGGGPPETENSVTLNVARAWTRGVELALVALPLEDLTLGFNLFVGEGEITEGDPGGNIPDHTPIPQLARLSYSGFASYTATRWPVFGFTPSLQFDMRSTGSRTPFPTPVGLDSTLEGFQVYGVQLGMSSERWEMSVGVKNLTDERSQLNRHLLEYETVTVSRPRTWVVRVGYEF